jgi:hypothetical protein
VGKQRAYTATCCKLDSLKTDLDIVWGVRCLLVKNPCKKKGEKEDYTKREVKFKAEFSEGISLARVVSGLTKMSGPL